MSEEHANLDRVLTIELARVTEAAAIAASFLVGRGDEKAADQAAVDAMRSALNTMNVEGTVVIGEGERDDRERAEEEESHGAPPPFSAACASGTHSIVTLSAAPTVATADWRKRPCRSTTMMPPPGAGS